MSDTTFDEKVSQHKQRVTKKKFTTKKCEKCSEFISSQKKCVCCLFPIIEKNDNVKNCKSNPNKDSSSLSSLIDRPLSQSDCIKLGSALENVVRDIILALSNLGLQNIKQKNMKGIKEKDHLFYDPERRVIYYAELKSNLNLDTEKSKSTYEKCLIIVEELKQKYPDYTIKWALVGCRYFEFQEITNTIKCKYNAIKDNLFGMNEYLDLLNVDIRFTLSSYRKFLNKIADTMFE